MQYPPNRKSDIQRIYVGVTRCLNPACQKPLKYWRNKYNAGLKGYCSRACKAAYTPTMVYFSRLYQMHFRDVLIYLLNQHGGVSKVAEDLEVRKNTILKWVRHFGIKKDEGHWI